MRPLLLAVIALLSMSCPGVAQEPAATPAHVDSTVRALLAETDTFGVEWGPAVAVDASAELEVGSGYGHGGDLTLYRFRPAGEAVEVLAISLDEGREQYHSTWPPDVVPVTVSRAVMDAGAYRALLDRLAAVAGATIRAKPTNSYASSSGNFWAFVLHPSSAEPTIRAEYVGYPSTRREPELVRPRAMATLVWRAVQALRFEEAPLDQDERAWASARLVRDIRRLQGEDFAWWVVERSIRLVGVVGDASALPELRRLLDGDPRGRRVYNAINAITRLVGVDVRPSPVEEMDVEATRQRVRDLLDRR